MSDGPACRCCGSHRVSVKGRKPGQFIRREFEFHACANCGFTFVTPFSGFAIYNDAYYRGEGPDPYVDYETEYRDWRKTDRMLELEDLVRIAESHIDRGVKGAGSGEQGAGPDVSTHVVVGCCGGAVSLEVPRPTDHSLPVAPPSPPAPCSLPALSLPNGLPAPAGVAGLPPLRWLDFGCGAGALLKFLRERGTIADRPVELTGHDVGSYAELLKNNDGFRILDWDQLSAEPAERYDVISMIEVIEHLPEPRVPLALAARLLKPGGLLLLTTGNLGSPIARRQGIDYRYCAPEIHVSLFNPHCLAELYRQVGLQPLAVRYDGVVKFKVVKSVRHHHAILRRLLPGLLRLPPVVWAIDAAYGVSAMPCAVKPG